MTQKTAKKKSATVAPPQFQTLPALHISEEALSWLRHYWAKLGLPDNELANLAVTHDRREYAKWTGRRLNSLALGCYCYMPHLSSASGSEDLSQSMLTQSQTSQPIIELSLLDSAGQLVLPGFGAAPVNAKKSSSKKRHRHLIFIEKDLLPMGIEVTVAHELIHLSDRYKGNPRKHHCHGSDAIAADEAKITGYAPDALRTLLADETARRERALRETRPVKYIYVCDHCGKEYPRVKRYPRTVSCGVCDRAYNPDFKLRLAKSL